MVGPFREILGGRIIVLEVADEAFKAIFDIQRCKVVLEWVLDVTTFEENLIRPTAVVDVVAQNFGNESVDVIVF